MKKIIILLVTLVLACGIALAQAFVSKYENEVAIRGDIILLNAHCSDSDGSCLYRCPVCNNLYEAVDKKGPLTSGPQSCGCGGSNNPVSETINP